MTVREVAEELQVWGRITEALAGRSELLEMLSQLPVRSSRALTRLGSYVCRGGRPVCIRLQFQQERKQLQDTLLHEVAHALDHCGDQAGRVYRNPHGEGWQHWMRALGLSAERRGESERLAALYHQRRKLVAVCERCGAEIYRLRRFDRRKRYRHRACGGILQPR